MSLSPYDPSVVAWWLDPQKTARPYFLEELDRNMIHRYTRSLMLSGDSAFLAPPEYIQDGLHLKLSKNPREGTLDAEIHFYDENEKEHIVTDTVHATGEETILQFICDFPDAVFLNEQRRPLMIMKKIDSQRKQPMGYLSYQRLKEIFLRHDHTEIMIAVP